MADRELKVIITGDSRDLQRALKDSDDGTKSFGKSLKSMSKLAGAAVGGAAIGGLVLGLKSAQEAASNLGESQNAVNVVFGKSAKIIQDFSKNAAQKAGLSMRELNESVTPLGASLINVGYSQDQAAKASINLAKRAADMASVFNTDVGTALEAIQAGLRGEADPLEKFGVGLSDAAVKSEALQMGLAKTEKGLTAQDKAQARVNLLMEQTNRLQGDFANTSDGAANAQRVLNANIENLQATIGQKLTPVFADLVVKLNEVVTWVITHWPEIQAEFQKSMDNIKKVIDRIKPILQTIIDQIVIVAKLIKALVEGDWSEVWEQLKAAAVNAIKLMIQLIKLEIQVIFTVLKALGKAALEGLEDGAKGLANVILDEVESIPGQLLALGKLLYNAALSIGKRVIDGIVDGVRGVGSAIGGAIGDGIKAAINFLIDRINAAINFDLHIPGIGPIGGKTIHIGYTIPHLAKGGVVTEPTLALIGEKGPEAVVPLGSGVGGGTYVFHFPNYLGDKRDLERSLQQMMRRFEDSNGISFTGRALA